MIEQMVSVGELARITGLHEQTIYRKARDGEIPGAVKLGRSVRFRESAINGWLNGGTGREKQQETRAE